MASSPCSPGVTCDGGRWLYNPVSQEQSRYFPATHLTISGMSTESSPKRPTAPGLTAVVVDCTPALVVRAGLLDPPARSQDLAKMFGVKGAARLRKRLSKIAGAIRASQGGGAGSAGVKASPSDPQSVDTKRSRLE